MTLHEATRKCLIAFHDELPERFKWREGAACEGDYGDHPVCPQRTSYHRPHDIPMPEPSDELAMALLRIAQKRWMDAPLTDAIKWLNDDYKKWTRLIEAIEKADMDPRDAIIFVCAELADRLARPAE